MFFKNKSILITGGAGFIGSHVADKCLEEGAERVTCLDNFIAGNLKNISHLSNEPRFVVQCGDINNFELMKQLVQNSDYVFHEAASKLVASLKNPGVDLDTNIKGTFNILEAARDSDARIVHASTGSVFGSSEKPMDENHPKNPTTLYGISKLAGEKYVLFYAKEFGIKASVLRYFHVYGPRQDFSGEAGVINIFLSNVLQGKPPIVFGTGEQIRCFTYITDDVDATLLLAKEKAAIGEDYNVASDVRMSVKELADIVIERYAKDSAMKPVMGPTRQGENLRPIPGTSKIEALGFRTKVPFEEGLERTKRWIDEELSSAANPGANSGTI